MKNLVYIFIIVLLLILIIGCDQLKGDKGDVGSKGATGVAGSDGQSIVGLTGPSGSDGRNGQDGTNGNNGRDGVDANPVTVVKLCPNSTAHYPDVFVEVALCINNQLYAVYSIPGAFMTLLPPGRYRSIGIGSACDLTVSEGCIVSP